MTKQRHTKPDPPPEERGPDALEGEIAGMPPAPEPGGSRPPASPSGEESGGEPDPSPGDEIRED